MKNILKSKLKNKLKTGDLIYFDADGYDCNGWHMVQGDITIGLSTKGVNWGNSIRNLEYCTKYIPIEELDSMSLSAFFHTHDEKNIEDYIYEVIGKTERELAQEEFRQKSKGIYDEITDIRCELRSILDKLENPIFDQLDYDE